MRNSISKYIAISPNYSLFSKEGRVFIVESKMNKRYVISPIMGMILSRITGERRLRTIIDEINSLFSEDVDVITYLEKVSSFFSNFFILSDNVIKKEQCSFIEITDTESLRPLYFDILKANRLTGPKTIVYNVTNECKFSCIYCHSIKNKRSDFRNSFVSLDVLKDFFLQAKKSGCEKVILTGGDPLLHPNIAEIIHILHELGIYTFLSTKTIIDNNILEDLVQSGLDEIQYSVDAVDAEILTRLGIFVRPEDILSSMDLIVKSNLNYQIKCVVTNANVNEIPSLLENCLLRKVYNVGFNLYSGSKDDPLVSSKEDVEKLSLVFEKYKQLGMKLDYSFAKKPHICGSLVHTLYLNENGDVSYCFKDYKAQELLLGNIAKQTLNNIWNGELAYKFLTPDQNSFQDKQCIKCRRFEKCIYYGCYYDRYYMNGTPFSRTQECIC